MNPRQFNHLDNTSSSSSSSSFNPYNHDDINNDINRRKRKENDYYAYEDDSEYDEDKSRELQSTKRRAGRPKGSKNKPKLGQFHRDEYIPKPQIYEMPPFIPSLVLSSYSGTALEESYDDMIKVSENMSLVSLKQECDARGCTYKRYKSIGKDELLFLLEPGTIAIHMTKVYNDLQILTRKLEGIKQENERIRTGKEEQRLQNMREEESLRLRHGGMGWSGDEKHRIHDQHGRMPRDLLWDKERLDQQSRERLEREQREMMQYGHMYPNQNTWGMPPVPNGYPMDPNAAYHMDPNAAYHMDPNAAYHMGPNAAYAMDPHAMMQGMGGHHLPPPYHLHGYPMDPHAVQAAQAHIQTQAGQSHAAQTVQTQIASAQMTGVASAQMSGIASAQMTGVASAQITGGTNNAQNNHSTSTDSSENQGDMQDILQENKKKLLAEGAFVKSSFHSKCNLYETARLLKGCSADHLADWMLCCCCNEVSKYACVDCSWSICKKCSNKDE
jgi:hypothetical protein